MEPASILKLIGTLAQKAAPQVIESATAAWREKRWRPDAEQIEVLHRLLNEFRLRRTLRIEVENLVLGEPWYRVHPYTMAPPASVKSLDELRGKLYDFASELRTYPPGAALSEVTLSLVQAFLDEWRSVEPLFTADKSKLTQEEKRAWGKATFEYSMALEELTRRLSIVALGLYELTGGEVPSSVVERLSVPRDIVNPYTRGS